MGDFTSDAIGIPVTREYPFLWDAANGMRFLTDVLEDDFGFDLTGWRLGEVIAMSHDGLTIIGRGELDNQNAVWIAHLESPAIPEPSSLALLGGLLAVVAIRRKRTLLP